MPRSMTQAVSISTGSILKMIALIVGVAVLWEIRDVLLSLFIALLLAGVIYPFAHWASQHKFPKGLAVILFYIITFGLFGLAFSLLVPALLEEAKVLASTYGASWEWVRDLLSDLNQLIGSETLRRDLFSLREMNVPAQAQQAIGGILSTSFDVFSAVFGGIAGLIVVLVLALYIIVEESAVRNVFHALIPEKHYEFASRLAWQIIQKLGSWFRGQVILGLVIGILVFLGYTAIGVPYALLLALLAGLMEFIPYVGPFLSAIPALFLAFTVSLLHLLLTLGLIVIVQQLENHLIVPKVMQKTVGLNPIVSVVAFLIGAKLFGIVGALFAIPVATACHVAFVEWQSYRR